MSTHRGGGSRMPSVGDASMIEQSFAAQNAASSLLTRSRARAVFHCLIADEMSGSTSTPQPSRDEGSPPPRGWMTEFAPFQSARSRRIPSSTLSNGGVSSTPERKVALGSASGGIVNAGGRCRASRMRSTGMDGAAGFAPLGGSPWAAKVNSQLPTPDSQEACCLLGVGSWRLEVPEAAIDNAATAAAMTMPDWTIRAARRPDITHR